MGPTGRLPTAVKGCVCVVRVDRGCHLDLFEEDKLGLCHDSRESYNSNDKTRGIAHVA